MDLLIILESIIKINHQEKKKEPVMTINISNSTHNLLMDLRG